MRLIIPPLVYKIAWGERYHLSMPHARSQKNASVEKLDLHTISCRYCLAAEVEIHDNWVCQYELWRAVSLLLQVYLAFKERGMWTATHANPILEGCEWGGLGLVTLSSGGSEVRWKRSPRLSFRTGCLAQITGPLSPKYCHHYEVAKVRGWSSLCNFDELVHLF